MIKQNLFAIFSGKNKKEKENTTIEIFLISLIKFKTKVRCYANENFKLSSRQF